MIPNINIHLRNKCNHACEVCFEDFSGSLIQLDKVKLLEFIDEVSPAHVGFVGGEPTLYPELSELLSELHARNIHTCVVTNGEFLDNLTVLPKNLSIGIDNYDQEKVDGFLATNPKCNIEITITPTDLSVIDGLMAKYVMFTINISALAFWDINPTVLDFITPEYVSKMKELKQLGVKMWGPENVQDIEDFYNKVEGRTYNCISPLNIYPDGSLQFCDINKFPIKLSSGGNSTITNHEELIKPVNTVDKCRYCNLKR